MSRIESIHALEILDSRGNPTLKVHLTTDNGFTGCALVPSGASTGEYEALELRDGDKNRYFGKGVQKACANVNGPIAKLLKGHNILDQEALDQLMIETDGTENKARFGANAILGVSMASLVTAASVSELPLYAYLAKEAPIVLPCPMINILNGGAHADNGLDFQEFMIRPIGAPSFKEAIRYSVEIFHTLKALLKKAGYTTSVGDEGGFAPGVKDPSEALDFIMKAIEEAGYRPGEDIQIALDCAASEFFDPAHNCYLEKKNKQQGKPFISRTTDEQIAYLQQLTNHYPIDSIEDGLDQNDWEGWKKLTQVLGKTHQIVGDDLFVTNPKFLRRGIQEASANAILIKLNQIGTVSETLHTIKLAKNHRLSTIISHRSGETEDTIIADFAAGLSLKQIKTGSVSKSDRVAKYNRLLEIEEALGTRAIFAGKELS